MPTTIAGDFATPLGPTLGGTGFASYAVGDLLYASSTTALSKLADVAAGSVLVSGGVGVAPAWSTSLSLAGGNFVLGATGQLQFGTNGQWLATNNLIQDNGHADGPGLYARSSTATVPSLVPNRAANTTGIGGVSGHVASIVGGATVLDVSAALVAVASGSALHLGNAAVTGLTPGVLAATTNATLVLTDSGGQAYRIPCII